MLTRQHLFKVIVPVIAIVAPIGLMEIGLRIVKKPTYFSGWKAERLDLEEKNQLGYRGQKIEYSPDDFVVVLVGDSQVYAARCAFDWMPEARLEHHLNHSLGKKVKVFSVAAEGWGTDQELLALEEYFNMYRADAVMLWFTPQNDLENNMRIVDGHGIGKIKPTYWLEEGKLAGPLYPWMQPVTFGPFKIGLLLERAGFWQSLQTNWLKTHRSGKEESLALTYALLKKIEGLVKSHGALFIPFWGDLRKQLKRDAAVTEAAFRDIKFLRLSVDSPKPLVGPLDSHLNEHAVDKLMEKLAKRAAD